MSSSPFCPPEEPAAANPQLRHRQIQVVAHDQKVFVRYLIKVSGGQHTGPAQVHVCPRRQQQGLFSSQVGFHHLALKRRLAGPTPNSGPDSPRTAQPTLCRVRWYRRPGLPSPTTSFMGIPRQQGGVYYFPPSLLPAWRRSPPARSAPLAASSPSSGFSTGTMQWTTIASRSPNTSDFSGNSRASTSHRCRSISGD